MGIRFTESSQVVCVHYHSFFKSLLFHLHLFLSTVQVIEDRNFLTDVDLFCYHRLTRFKREKKKCLFSWRAMRGKERSAQEKQTHTSSPWKSKLACPSFSFHSLFFQPFHLPSSQTKDTLCMHVACAFLCDIFFFFSFRTTSGKSLHCTVHNVSIFHYHWTALLFFLSSLHFCQHFRLYVWQIALEKWISRRISQAFFFFFLLLHNAHVYEKTTYGVWRVNGRFFLHESMNTDTHLTRDFLKYFFFFTHFTRTVSSFLFLLQSFTCSSHFLSLSFYLIIFSCRSLHLPLKWGKLDCEE